MSDLIRVDHDQMAQVAGKFEQNAQKTSQMLQELQRPYQGLKEGGWIGQGATAFYAEMDGKVIPSLRRLIQALSQAGQATNDISGVMRSADEEASSNFKQNEGGVGAAGGMLGGLGAAMGGALGGGLGSALGGGLGSAIGSALGGGGGGFSSPSGFAGSGGFGGFGGSGITPQTNIGGIGRGFDMFGGSGSGGGAGQAPGASARFHYQPVAGMGGSATGGAGGLQFGSVGGLLSSMAGGGFNGMPLVMAVATPFVAMLGKAIKSKMDGN